MSCRGEPFHRVVNNKTTEDLVFSAGKVFYLNFVPKIWTLYHFEYEHSILFKPKIMKWFRTLFSRDVPRSIWRATSRRRTWWPCRRSLVQCPKRPNYVGWFWSKSRFFGLPVFSTEKEPTKELLVYGRKILVGEDQLKTALYAPVVIDDSIPLKRDPIGIRLNWK